MWGWKSTVIHSTADAATGPFVRKGVAVGAEAHNPVVSRAVDGTWLIWTCGCPNPKAPAGCGHQELVCPGGAQGAWTTTVYSSKSLDGPWQPHVDLLGGVTRGRLGSQNVSPIMRPDGSVELMFKGPDNNTEASIAVAPHWSGPYRLVAVNIFGRYYDDNITNEDVYWWHDAAGYHALSHRMEPTNRESRACGGHAFAEQLDDWHFAETPAYSRDIAVRGGGTLELQRRERPQVFLDRHGQPTTLYSAVSTSNGSTFTFAQPLGEPKEEAASPPLKVFILMGQSNMVGMAEVATVNKTSGRPLNGTLAYQLTDPRTAAQFAPLWDTPQNNWTVLQNVAMWYNEVGSLGKDGGMVNGSKIPGVDGVDACFGPLTVGYGAKCGANGRNNIGPELGFGFGMRQHLPAGEKFLIMKNAWGGKTLAGDFRPPSSAAAADPYCTGPACKRSGHFWNVSVANVQKLLAKGAIGAMFPELAHMQPEIAGVGWWQGWNDGCDVNQTAAYEANMVNFIKDVRTTFSNPTLPVSIITAGFLSTAMAAAEEASRTPKNPKPWVDWSVDDKLRANCAGDRGCRREDIVLSQLAATDPSRHPELQGHAHTADTRGFWREAQYSPNRGQGYHYWHNAETYYLSGLAMAAGMVKAM